MKWSDIPDTVLHDLTRLGYVAKYISNMLFPYQGYATFAQGHVLALCQEVADVVLVGLIQY